PHLGGAPGEHQHEPGNVQASELIAVQGDEACAKVYGKRPALWLEPGADRIMGCCCHLAAPNRCERNHHGDGFSAGFTATVDLLTKGDEAVADQVADTTNREGLLRLAIAGADKLLSFVDLVLRNRAK